MGRRRALGLVRPVRHGLGGSIVGQPFERDRIPRAVPGELGGEGAIVFGDSVGRVDVEAGVRPREHPGGLVRVEEITAYEQSEHGAAERFRQPRRVVSGPGDECAVRPEASVGDEQVQVRMPVGARAVRL